MIATSVVGDIVRKQLQQKLGVKVEPGRLDGLVADVHIYENTYEKAQQVVLSTYTKKLLERRWCRLFVNFTEEYPKIT